jgi:ABC-type Fe3+-hydroxamate transport system, periplasmic component
MSFVNHRQRPAVALLAAVLAVGFAAGVYAAPAGFSVTDALGRKVEFKAPPQRIAVNGKALFMIADAIYLFPEASSRIVAIGNAAQGKYNFPKAIDPNFGAKVILDGQAGAEEMAAAHPDAVILKSSMAGSLGKAVEALGIPVVYVDFETPEQYERDLGTLGVLFQNEARARQIVAAYRERLSRLSASLGDIPEGKKPRALVLYYNEQGGTVSFNVPPLGWMQSVQVALGGGDPVWKGAQLGQGWTKATIEQIASWDPDSIFVIAYFSDLGSVLAKLKDDPRWAALGAVKAGRLYGFAGDYYSWDQPDPRWILGTQWIAKKLNPDRLKGMDMKAEARSFYRDFYGMDDASYAKLIGPLLPEELR